MNPDQDSNRSENGSFSETDVKNIKSEFRGDIILPNDSGYEQARKIWNGMIDKRPAIIARCMGASDVVKSVKFARDHHLVVAVRGGGHNVSGNAVCNGGIMIDLSMMKSVRVDIHDQSVRAEPGVTWRQFDLETQVFGLASTGGLVSTTGISGFTLGGGIGWLTRKHGLALDNLKSVDLVTSTGNLVTANANENSDLFWGVRGGGGNFGIVTSFEYQLHPVGPIILGGLITYRAEQGEEVLKFYREFVKGTPDELTTLAAYITAPPLPFIPKDVHGSHLVAISVCYCGKIEEGQKVLEPLRRFGSPVLDVIQPMPYLVLQSMLDEAAPSGIQNYWKSSYISSLNDEAIKTVLRHGEKITSPLSAIHIHQLGGALNRIGDDETAFSHRDAPLALNIISSWLDPSENNRHITWTRNFFNDMQVYSRGVYVNFMGEEDAGRVKEAYDPAKYSKLVALKNKYDPDNMFHLNQNIVPTAQKK